MTRGKVYCQSCGYIIDGCPAAPECENPEWHKFDIQMYKNYLPSAEGKTDQEITDIVFKNQQDAENCVSGTVTYKVHAEVIKAAARLGLNRAQMTSKIIRDWAAAQIKENKS